MSIVQFRKKRLIVCQICGKQFIAYPQAKYCSSTCRSRTFCRKKSSK